MDSYSERVEIIFAKIDIVDGVIDCSADSFRVHHYKQGLRCTSTLSDALPHTKKLLCACHQHSACKAK